MLDTVTRAGSSAPDVDPSWYAGQPETADAVAPEAPGQPASSHVPSVLQKLLKWGNYAGYGTPVWPSRFVPMKTPLSEQILDSWELPEPPKHRLTVPDLLAAQTAAGRHVGLLLDLSNHDCLYASDVPSSVQYLHVQLVAKELPPLEFVREVGRAANQFWSQNSDDYIAIHCAYGFNRTGFVVASYLIEHCALSVEQALASFARSRPPGVKHERFRDELHARYGSINQALPRGISCVHAPAQFAAVLAGNSSGSGNGGEQELRGLLPLFMQLQQRQGQLRLQSGAVQQQQQGGSQCSSATQVWCQQAAGSSGCGDRCCCGGSCQCSQAVTCSESQPGLRSSNSKQHCEPAAGSFSTASRSVSFACDGVDECLPLEQQQQQPRPLGSSNSNSSSRGQLSTSPLPRLPARCYSSCSVGDNSSIGCSPDSQADILLQGVSGSSSSALGSIRGYRVPVGLVGCSPVQGLADQQQHLQQQLGVDVSPAGSSGRLGHASDAGDRQQRRQQQAEQDFDCFELDPCGEERGSSGWCDGSSCCSAVQQQHLGTQQQHKQHAADMSSLMSGLEAVQLGPQQQQQQQQRFEQLSPGQAATTCSCICHISSQPPSSCGGDSTADPASEQQQQPSRRRRSSRLRYSSEGSGLRMGSSSGGGGPELLDNESFGKVTSAELLRSLRALQPNCDAN